MVHKYIKKILNARVYDVAIETPLTKAELLSLRFRNNLWLKREDLQPIFSFKIRGAYNKVSQLSREEKNRGVITASAGNHAQGLALSAQKLGIKAIVVMPCTTPEIKVESVRSRGADVILKGDAFDEASAYAQDLSKKHGYVYIPPYDDEDVIAGQGTIAMEILSQHTDPVHAVFVPVGGGGLIAGVAVYIKFVRPDIKVIGVESDDSACMYEALKQNSRVILDDVGIFADGVAVRQVGKLPFEIARESVDEVIKVSTDEICAAIKDVFDDTRSISEPAGALAVAGMKKYIERTSIEDKNLISIVSGANMNFDRLRYVSERTEVGEKREAILAVTLDEKPGSFKAFIQALSQRSITEFNYRYFDKASAQVFVGVQIRHGGKDREELITSLKEKGYPVVDLTDNDLAKEHIRHMVGSHTPGNTHERVYRFEFPERPGALMKFLLSLGQRWNISLFHYRNHGSTYSRILMGVQVADKEVSDLELMLKGVGFRFSEETNNPACQLFLGGISR